MTIFKCVIFLTVSCVQFCGGARILAFFPFPGTSHQAVFTPIIRGLCERGHHVAFYSPFPTDGLTANCTHVKIGNYFKDILKIAGMEEGYGAQIASQQSNFMWASESLREVGLGLAELTLRDPRVKELIASDRQFDLVLLETTFFQEAFIAFHHKFEAPVVEILPPSNSHWTYCLYGNPYDTSYIVDMFNRFTDEMNFEERLSNTITSIVIRANYFIYYMPKYQALMDRLFRYPGWESRPPLVDMITNSSLLLMNSHVALNYPYPLSPNVKEIGGVHLQTRSKPLPKDLQEFMDSATDGVIYFTFGSYIQVASTLGDSLKREFVKVFSKLKLKVLWKWEKEFRDAPANVKISKWFPQQDVLAHKNVKLFISHGGLLSITEAVVNGVPIIGVPILGDQPKNVKHMSRFGYGVGLDFNNLTEATISCAIHQVLDNPRYKENALRAARLLKDEAQTPLDKALFWIEYVLRHDGAHHLRPAVLRLNWLQQAMIDVYAALVFLCISTLLLLYTSISLLIMCFRAKWSSGSRGKTKRKLE